MKILRQELRTDERGLPSCMEIPVNESDIHLLESVAREIYEKTGILVKFTPPKIRSDIIIE